MSNTFLRISDSKYRDVVSVCFWKMNTFELFNISPMKPTRCTGFLLSLVLLFPALVLAQQKFPQHYFRPPVDFPITLSGSFGELRSGHLHSGLDIKTGGVQGKKVYAVADGYVSRIGISLGGYGKALYITHPNGYVSVYGHLKTFNREIQQYVKKIQYQRKSYTVQIFPPKNRLLVKKGEVIAYSGNTGGSLGPHLHFEIRNAKTAHPVNPLLFGSIRIRDNLPPKIAHFAVYPVMSYSLVNGKHDTLVWPVAGHGKSCYLKNLPVIDVSGPVSFGLRTYDVMNGVPNKNGIYSLKLYRDGKLVFALKTDSLSFSTTRYVNSLIDYSYFEKKGKRLIRTQRDTNNRLGIYRRDLNHGIFNFKDTLTHHFRYVVTDAYGNTATLAFKVKDTPSVTKKANPTPVHPKGNGIFIHFNRAVRYSQGNLTLMFPKDCFYRSFYLQVSKLPANDSTLSPVYKVHNRFVPVQKYFTLTIKAGSVPEKLKRKTYIAYSPDEKSGFFYTGGKWDGNSIFTKTRYLGFYTLMADTTAPNIKPLNFGNKSKVTGKSPLKVRIKDDGSGIKNYTGTLNGHWILMEYDPKTDRLTYYPDQYLKKGKNIFRLTVTDNRGNKSQYNALIYN